jgi:hypothetical protein
MESSRPCAINRESMPGVSKSLKSGSEADYFIALHSCTYVDENIHDYGDSAE